MNRNNRFLFTIVATFSMLISLAVVFANTNLENKAFNSISGDPYTRTVSDVTSNSLLLSNDYQISLESSGFTDGSLFSLSNKGYIRNTEPIRGITSISVSYEVGSGYAQIVPCYYDYESDAVVTSNKVWPEASTSADFTSSPIDYFELYNPQGDDITITSISISYGCSTAMYTFSVSFTPNWNGKEAENPADIYIAGTKELIGDGTLSNDENWRYKKLTYSDGLYSYNAPASLPTGKYVYAFFAEENGAVFDWRNPNTRNNIELFLESNVTDSYSYSWTSEPGYVSSSTYTLHLTVTASGTPSSFGNMQFIYSTSDDSNYTWPSNTDYIATSWSSPFSYTKSGLDAEQTIYFKIYMWSDSMNLRVGSGDNNFSLTPTGAADEYVNVSFTYSTSGTTSGDYKIITGTSEHIIKVNSVSVDRSSLTLEAGENDTLVATVYPTNATNKAVAWTSNNTTVATVSDGVVTARAAGNAVITVATIDGNKTATCNVTVTSASQSTSMTFANQNTSVYGSRIQIIPTFDKDAETFTASYSGEDIRIDEIDGNHYITGLKAGTSTTVTLTSSSGLTCNFTVSVAKSTYTATSTRDNSYNDRAQITSVEENWFTHTDVDEIDGMGSDFMNGVDISNTKALYDNGTKFYNASGVEQSLFYIFKDAGVNWVRLRLWVDPYTDGGVSYGGGECDLDNVLWMAYETKRAGLNLLLDFHYSDYWTHPGTQILPKAWASAGSVAALSAYIETYTTDTLNRFKDENCLPDMVQLGNEISSGSFLQVGKDSESFTDYKPNYAYSTSNFAYQGSSGGDNMKAYLTAASDGVNAVSNSIKKVIHWAKGGSISANTIKNWFNNFTSIDFDYAGISFYPFYCFNSISVAQNILNGLGSTLGGKPWFIAETSYPFSGYSWVYENAKNVTDLTITNWTTSTNASEIAIRDSYAFTGPGQANLIHDLTSAVVSAGGKGIFYWEAAWVPNANVGWAGAGSGGTYCNQGFFSYNGKAIANIDLFKQMSPHI